jgi:hypothetical protein
MDAKQYKGFWWLFGNKEEDIPGILEIIEGVSFKLTVFFGEPIIHFPAIFNHQYIIPTYTL